MSWFPSSDLPRSRSPFSPNPGFLSAPSNPTASHHQQRHQQRQENFTNDTTHHGLPFVHPSWEAHDSHGLGLFTQPIVGEPTYTMPTVHPSMQSTTVPYAWPSEFTVSQPCTTLTQPLRKDSWSSESCNPLSTLLPGALWDHRYPIASRAAPYAASPGRSDYSTSSRPSVVSSPYNHSDVYVRSVDSPQVKIENLQDQTIPQTHFIPSAPQHEQSQHVNPEDLIAQPSAPVEERIKTYLGSSSSSDVGDFKPDISRPDRRRAYSSADILEARRKRGYTSPENAVCSCKICGKLFQRSYNLKAHMETHDPDRDHPHICEYAGCGRSFVRRTDLIRHVKGVSLCSLVKI